MSAETYHETPEHLQADSDLFLESLEAVTDNPHETLVVMQTALGVDIGRRLNFPDNIVRDDPETMRNMSLSLAQYEGIKSFEELVRIYVEHGTYTPAKLGAWFNAQRVDIVDPARKRPPIDMLFEGFSEEGFDRDDVRQVSWNASVFLNADGYAAVRARWGD